MVMSGTLESRFQVGLLFGCPFSSLTPSLENRDTAAPEPMECRAAPDLGFEGDCGLGTIRLHNGRTSMVWGILSSSSRLCGRPLPNAPCL